MSHDYTLIPVDDERLPVLMRSDNHRGPPSEWANFCIQLSKLPGTNAEDKAFWTVFASDMMSAQVFDFGVVDDKDLCIESKRGGELWTKGYLRAPYKQAIYWYENLPDPDVVKRMVEPGDPSLQNMLAPQRYCTLFTTMPTYVNAPPEWREPLMMIADFIRLDEFRGEHRHAYALGGAALIGSAGDGGGWMGRRVACDASATKDRSNDGAICGSLIDGVVGLSMILATKNVPTRVEPVSAKLNAKRIASGKEPLVSVTHVNSRAFHDGLRNARLGGTHASPVPHLRRGHLRTYADGRKIWINDMLVNARSANEVKRDHYEVETHDRRREA